MSNQNQMVMVYETMLALPSMKETVKFNQGIRRSDVLLLSQLIEAGLNSNDIAIQDLLAAMPSGTAENLTSLAQDFLDKAGLIELHQKLKAYQQQSK